MKKNQKKIIRKCISVESCVTTAHKELLLLNF